MKKELLHSALVLVCIAAMVIGFGICVEDWTIYPVAALVGAVGLAGAVMTV